MRLTDLQIKKLHAPTQGQKTYFDEGMPGFGLRVSQGGARSFVVVYGKKRQLKTIGRYPDVGLADARRAAKKLLGDLATLPLDTPELPTVQFETARTKFLADTATRTKESTSGEYRRLLEKYFTYEKKVREITRADIMKSVDAIEGAPSERHHAFVAIRTMMNWCVKRGLLDVSPVPRLSFQSQARTRVLSDAELKAVWERAEAFGYPYGTVVQLLILTGQRRGEIVGLRRTWVADQEIFYPAGFTKNKYEHRLPIGARTGKILDAVPGEDDHYFQSEKVEETIFNSWSKSKVAFDKPLQIAPYTLHDLRRTYSSNLARLGVPIHVTEKLLNHVSGTISGVAAVYNRHTYQPEMREAVTAYEQFIGTIVDAK